MRLGEEFQDRDDVAVLIQALGFTRFEQAEAVLARYFPLERYPAKARYILEELLRERPSDEQIAST
jgi:hypothetical protein